MAIVVTTDGLTSKNTYSGTLLAWLNTLTLRLFQNNHTLVVTDHLSALTEATFTGYASQAWNDFASVGIDGNDNDLYDWPDHVFTQSGTGVTNTVYGWYATDVAGKLVMGENGSVPISMNNTGNTATVHADPGYADGQLSGPP